MTNKFPRDFIFGAATAAYQAEGATNVDGKGKTYWDDYLKEKGYYDPSVSSDFYHKYPKDLELCKEFGINGIRISIAWTRIFPEGNGEVNKKGIEFYHKLIDKCIEEGVEPFVTLHHFDTPYPLYEKGDWLAQETINNFVEFAKVCFEEYGNKVNKWITINEPWSVVAGQYIIGHFPPNIKYDLPKAIQAMHNMMVAHSKVVNLYKSMKLSGEIGIVHILESKYPITDSKENKKASLYEDTLANRFMLDATFKGEYDKKTMDIVLEILEKHNGKLEINDLDMKEIKEASKKIDFLGINYYASHFLKAYDGESNIFHNGTGEKGTSIFALKGIGERVTNPEIPTTDWDWPIYPKGLEDMLLSIKEQYPNYNKIYITENGMGDKDVIVDGKITDDNRIDYVKEHFKAILNAMEKGVEIKGYFIWSLMDLFSWTNGYNKRYGLFYVDFNTLERFPKKSAYWYKSLSENKELK
ncbi:MAG TPA: 6-phospho-beta-galactosidase [Gallicola sp.]|jgi:6-phospho-beta-galactosidase|nr:6-phospho-beta-galactosidase [Gallicola sp.]